MSEKRLLGWEPTEVHQHEYDADGRLVRTIVTRETEWDDTERSKMQGLAIFESQLCVCGLHESLTATDPDLEITLPICPVCAGIAQQRRVLEDQDEKAVKSLGENPAPGLKRPSDGRGFRLRAKPAPTEEP